jgi:hypothetical protein
MATDSPRPGSDLVPAPRSRRMLARAIDSIVLGGPPLAYRRSRRPGRGASQDDPVERAMNALGPLTSMVTEHLGSPGGWLMGLRTVDERTGRRLAWWRLVVVVSAQAGASALGQHLMRTGRAALASERRELDRDLQAIRDAHPDDPEAMQAQMRTYYAEHRVQVDAWRWLPPLLVGPVVNRLLRRLAPTRVVLARVPGPHSP